VSETTSVPAGQIEVGTTIRLADGRELLVSRIEPEFMGRPGLTAFIEDSPRQWFKAPMATDTLVEVVSPASG
jgi:hypothetical protein